jgi:enamine deaminase RidA (YjgF/YER057c/UK114 family)
MRKIAFSFLFLSASLLGAFQSGKQIIQMGSGSNYPFSPAVKAGNFIYVSGMMGTGAPGDVKAQTRRTLENIERILKTAGSSLKNAVSATVYMKNVSDFQAMNEAYREFWDADPPVRTTVQANLVMPEALIEISMIAVPAGAERRVILPQGWMKSPSPYSYGILSGDTLFLSGLVSRNGKDNSIVDGDMQSQTRTAMENAGEILKAAGLGYDAVVSSRVYISDTAKFNEMNTAYRGYFPKNPPARATVKAALVDPKYLVEITLLAVKGTHEAITAPNADGSAGQANPNLSAAIRVGNRLYLSGMLGGSGDIGQQTRETLARIGRTLKAAGFSWEDAVEGIVYLTDTKNFAGMNEAYREAFNKDFPARATVESGLVAPEGLVEIMFTAVK